MDASVGEECCCASLARSVPRSTRGMTLLAVFGCAVLRGVFPGFVRGPAPLSEGTATLPWRVVCIWLVCGRCLQCVARRLPRQRVWCVVDEGLNRASLARGRIAHSLPNAPAALVGFGGCWSVGGVCFTMTWDMVQLAFNTLFRSGRHRAYGEARWFKQRLPLRSALGDIRGPLVAHASLSKSCGLGRIQELSNSGGVPSIAAVR